MPPTAPPRSTTASTILLGNVRQQFGAFGIAAGCGRFPPLALLNQFLAAGRDPERGDDGGAWSPFELSPDDYAIVLAGWLATHPDTVVDDLGAQTWPDWVAALHRRVAGTEDWSESAAAAIASADTASAAPVLPETIAARALAGSFPAARANASDALSSRDLGRLFVECPCCRTRTVPVWRKLVPVAGGACIACHRKWRFSRVALPLAAATVLALVVFLIAGHPSLATLRLVLAVTFVALFASLLALPLRKPR